MCTCLAANCGQHPLRRLRPLPSDPQSSLTAVILAEFGRPTLLSHVPYTLGMLELPAPKVDAQTSGEKVLPGGRRSCPGRVASPCLP